MIRLNLNFSNIQQVLELDKTFVGTSAYMGLAYFWNYEYRAILRDASIAKRKRVHKALLKSGLELNGASDAHLAIIKS